MNGADHLFAAILLISLVLGCLRGFVREAISLLSWLIGLWLAWHFAYLLYPWLGGALAEPGIREWVGRAIVLFLTLLVGAAAGAIVSYFMQRAAGLAAMDRTLGGLFGMVRAVVVIGLLVIGGRAVNLDVEPWWQKTKSMSAAEAVANWLVRYAEPAAADLLDRAAETPRS
ncbi:MAG: CvpA family protein [Steroidobacteraceae bacterium]